MEKESCTSQQINRCIIHTANVHGVSPDEVRRVINSYEGQQNIPMIKVGDVSTYTRGEKYGRRYYDGFTVIEVVTDKRIKVEFDKPIISPHEN